MIHSRAYAQTIFSGRCFESQFRGALPLVEFARRRATVKFSQVGIVDLLVCSRDGAKVDVEVVSIDITEIVKVGPSARVERKLCQARRGLPGDDLTLHSKVIEGRPTVAALADELIPHILAARPPPDPHRHRAGRHSQIVVSLGPHFPTCDWGLGLSNRPHPHSVVAVVDKVKSAGGLPRLSDPRKANDQKKD